MNKNRRSIPVVLAIVNLLLLVAIVRSFRGDNDSEPAQSGGDQYTVTQSEAGSGDDEKEDVLSSEEDDKDKKEEGGGEDTDGSEEDSGDSSEPKDTTVSLVVIARDKNGDILDKYTKTGEIGETVSADAIPRKGYSVDRDSKNIVLSEDESENVITFYYEKIITVAYIIRCVDEDGNLLSETTDYGDVGSTIYLDAPEIEGYVPEQNVRDITLSSKEEDNLVVFEYKWGDNRMDIPDRNTCLYDGHTYYAYRTNSIDTFWEAESYAESRGGYLAVISDSDENRALYEYVIDDLGYESAYFGLVDMEQDGSWQWVDGSWPIYENWASGQPDKVGKENYALFWHKDPRYTWNNADFGKDSAGTVTFLIEWDRQ